MSDVLNVKKREERGTARTRRSRAAGLTPAVLYGHGKDTVALSIPSVEIDSAIRHGSQVVDLQGDLSENALIKEVQWDAFGTTVLHIDLTRVVKGERVEVTVPIELHGFAPGDREGGVTTHQLHEAVINSFVMKIPDNLECNVNELHLDESIALKDLELPEGVELVTDPETIVVSCSEPTEQPAEDGEGEEGAVSAEPEVIGGRKEDEEATEEG